MVNPAVFNSNFGEWKKRTKKDRYMILPQDLTLLKLVNFEDFVVMDVIDNIDFGKKNSVTSKQYEELKNAFIAFDRNCDGFIDSEDLGYVMGKLGHDLSSKEVKKVFKDICKHSNGKMDFTDFVEMMAQDKLVLTTSEQEILAAFQFLDQNHDGYITIDELLQRFHGCLSDTEASRLMCEADANGDGKIDFNEFKHMMFNQERSISLAQSEVELYS
ncbi:uncharacterized protein [Clytia hemisphaerica]|uniref:EF-hand domain-containing protein n=1 Tax=Clytia hemisphaerica TaxID=252671 RepID=A0A7M5VAX9_9CNID